MSWLEAIGYIFKLIGTIVDLKAKNQLTQAQLDAATAALHTVPDPKP